MLVVSDQNVTPSATIDFPVGRIDYVNCIILSQITSDKIRAHYVATLFGHLVTSDSPGCRSAIAELWQPSHSSGLGCHSLVRRRGDHQLDYLLATSRDCGWYWWHWLEFVHWWACGESEFQSICRKMGETMNSWSGMGLEWISILSCCSSQYQFHTYAYSGRSLITGTNNLSQSSTGHVRAWDESTRGLSSLMDDHWWLCWCWTKDNEWRFLKMLSLLRHEKESFDVVADNSDPLDPPPRHPWDSCVGVPTFLSYKISTRQKQC